MFRISLIDVVSTIEATDNACDIRVILGTCQTFCKYSTYHTPRLVSVKAGVSDHGEDD